MPAPHDDDDTTQLKVMIQGKPYLSFGPYLTRLRQIGAAKLDAIESEGNNENWMALWREYAVFGPDVHIVR